jgi:hypothetical protein
MVYYKSSPLSQTELKYAADLGLVGENQGCSQKGFPRLKQQLLGIIIQIASPRFLRFGFENRLYL